MKLLFVLFALFTLTDAVIEWPFKSTQLLFRPTIIEAFIGNPAQEVELELSLYDNCGGLGAKDQDFQVFNPNKSSTWNETGVYDNGDGISGTDDFVINDSRGNPQILRQAEFNIINKGICASESTLSLAHTTEDKRNLFLDSVLASEADKVVVVTYDKVPKTAGDGFSGKLTIGGRPKICSNWRMVNETPSYFGPKWQFKLDKVSAGKFIEINPGISDLSLLGPYFSLSSGTYDQIAKELGVHDKKIRCNSSKDIVFTINGFDLHIKPEEYMDRTKSNVDECDFFGISRGNNDFSLPTGVFNRYCLLLDFEHKQIGFGDRPPLSTGNRSNSYSFWLVFASVCLIFSNSF